MVAAILSGGQNRRLPFIKGFIEINDKRIIESQVELLRDIFKEVVISTNSPELYFYLGVPLIGDIVKQEGPMAGLLSVLICTGKEEVFIIGCDMPFIKPLLIRHIIKRKGKNATVPLFNGMPQPLLSVYSNGMIKVLESEISNLKSQSTGIKDILRKTDVRYIGEDEVRGIDPEGRSFVNINTPEDIEYVRTMCEKEVHP